MSVEHSLDAACAELDARDAREREAEREELAGLPFMVHEGTNIPYPQNNGERVLLAMRHLGNAFRYIEAQYFNGPLAWKPYADAVRIFSLKYEELRNDAYLAQFCNGVK